ncbi:unnamed protein product [Paramecium octaurelia]|uniref:Uncharacterized protein n=1 Tax=Paramecium octaurelia TaxID=43137 RepID=A0A8S1X7H3_PAROT|nr:unnamed protein product [Paramecium octaurelia]
MTAQNQRDGLSNSKYQLRLHFFMRMQELDLLVEYYIACEQDYFEKYYYNLKCNIVAVVLYRGYDESAGSPHQIWIQRFYSNQFDIFLQVQKKLIKIIYLSMTIIFLGRLQFKIHKKRRQKQSSQKTHSLKLMM